MAKEDEKDIEKETTTEEKAAEIGAAVDAEKEDEKAPDYEISEEGAEPAKEDEGDARLGKTRDADDKPRLSNREKRQLRKKKLAEKFDTKDRIIREQRDMINQLAARQNETDSRLSQVDQAQLQQAWNDTSAVFQQAEAEYTAAFETKNGAVATVAMRKMYEAQKRLDELQALNARMQQKGTQTQTAPKPDPIVANRAKEWSQRNTWFRPDGGDDDSAIANTIAAKLVKDGFDATTDEYWSELDERLAARGIGADEEDDDPAPRARRSPPVSGSGGRGDLTNGKVAITLPTAYINALKESGKWDNPETRNRMIKRYLDGLKARQSAGGR